LTDNAQMSKQHVERKENRPDRKVVGSIPMLDGSGVKAMPGSIPTPILVHSRIEKNQNTGSQMGHTTENRPRLGLEIGVEYVH
jgi:hypothetical protein